MACGKSVGVIDAFQSMEQEAGAGSVCPFPAAFLASDDIGTGTQTKGKGEGKQIVNIIHGPMYTFAKPKLRNLRRIALGSGMFIQSMRKEVFWLSLPDAESRGWR